MKGCQGGCIPGGLVVSTNDWSYHWTIRPVSTYWHVTVWWSDLSCIWHPDTHSCYKCTVSVQVSRDMYQNLTVCQSYLSIKSITYVWHDCRITSPAWKLKCATVSMQPITPLVLTALRPRPTVIPVTTWAQDSTSNSWFTWVRCWYVVTVLTTVRKDKRQWPRLRQFNSFII